MFPTERLTIAVLLKNTMSGVLTLLMMTVPLSNAWAISDIGLRRGVGCTVSRLFFHSKSRSSN